MAVTKIWSIRETLYLAIQYILNPNKAIFVTSHACAPETADLEFALTLEQNSRSGGTNKAFHIIQSFKPEETTPEQAHEIGKLLLEQHLEGKYEYVLTTHIDKSHIHNHVIFNASSYVDHKKYNDCKKTYYQLRDASDILCAEHSLSVIPPTKNKGLSHYEWQMKKEGNSWKQELQKAIDNCIQSTSSYEDFLTKLTLIGYEIKHGKHIAFRAKNQERFARGKSLGEEYTEEKIKERIILKAQLPVKRRKKISPTNQPLSIMIELNKNKKTIENKGYEHWTKIHNLKQSAKTINLLSKYNISTTEELENITNDISAQLQKITTEIKMVEKNIINQQQIKKHLSIYHKTKKIYSGYQKSRDKQIYYRSHTSDILLHKTSIKTLQKFKIDPDTILPNSLLENLSSQQEKKNQLNQEHKILKGKLREYQMLNQNVKLTLNPALESNKDNKER
ncbi:relaxase/mobilization nuclease domain-containing protein [Listeria monocytogenes]|uniref:relaxase/mobilization nuclease domain-containing protein n=1 Tax=Listeria monocytogenes TaxID=1639 RepID=UPI0011EA7365|nr:relaxase/mobilization nuclease domain-containing protein [Listeria monocytogenes]TYU88623.1 relaxase/mobilization nuclease domain-containing protein [Listeria monocytogenes]